MLRLKLQYFCHLVRTADSLEKSLMLAKIEGRRRGHQKITVWHHCCNEHKLGQTLGDGKGQRGLACFSPRGCKGSDKTGQLNNNNSNNAPSIRTPQYIRQIVTIGKREIDSSTITVRDFNSLFSSMGRSSKHKINTETLALNDSLYQMNLTDIYRAFYPIPAE